MNFSLMNVLLYANVFLASLCIFSEKQTEHSCIFFNKKKNSLLIHKQVLRKYKHHYERDKWLINNYNLCTINIIKLFYLFSFYNIKWVDKKCRIVNSSAGIVNWSITPHLIMNKHPLWVRLMTDKYLQFV